MDLLPEAPGKRSWKSKENGRDSQFSSLEDSSEEGIMVKLNSTGGSHLVRFSYHQMERKEEKK